jgi:hypothetical protein
MTRTLVSIVAGSLIALTGCSFVNADLSGEIVTDTRLSEPFTGVRLEGVGDITVVAGDTYTVQITADSALTDGVTTRIDDGILVIDENWSFRVRSPRIDVYVTVPSLESVSLAGVGDFMISGVDTEVFDVSLAGTGDITVAGQADEVSIRVAGTGDVNARELEGRDVVARVAGVGDITVSASHTLDASVAGIGDIVFVGNPAVTSSVRGIGSVHEG